MSETEDKSQQTEDASERKLEKAREKGDVFLSKEVNAFLSIFTLSLCIILFGKFFAVSLADTLKQFILFPTDIIHSLSRNQSSSLSENMMQIVGDLILDILPFLLVPALIMMIVNILGSLAQHGMIFSTSVIELKLERISPIAGFKRIFSFNSVMELLKGILKIILVGSIVYVVLKSEVKFLTHSYSIPIFGGFQLLTNTLIKLFVGICCFMFGLAVIDFLYQRFNYLNKMKMSKKEQKDEHKDQEGSPEVKSKLKSMRAKMSKKRVMAAVPNADVIITNPTHYAVALEYKPEKMDTPVMIAKGQDEIALMIRELAKKHKIPIVENPPLARLLYADLEMGMQIKEKHYKAVAEVISYIMKLQRKKFKI